MDEGLQFISDQLTKMVQYKLAHIMMNFCNLVKNYH